MNNKKQTAVDWLVEQFNLQAYTPHIDQAKEMEKKQIIDASTIGFADGLKYMNNETQNFENAEQYYKETYEQ